MGTYKIIDIPPMPAGQPQIRVTFEVTRMRGIFMTAGRGGVKMRIEKYIREPRRA